MSGTYYSKNYPNEKMENLPSWKTFRKMILCILNHTVWPIHLKQSIIFEWEYDYNPWKVMVIAAGLKFHHMTIRISNSPQSFILMTANSGTLLIYMQNRSRWISPRVSNTLNNSSVLPINIIINGHLLLYPCQIMMQIQITLNCFKYRCNQDYIHPCLTAKSERLLHDNFRL